MYMQVWNLTVNEMAASPLVVNGYFTRKVLSKLVHFVRLHIYIIHLEHLQLSNGRVVSEI